MAYPTSVNSQITDAVTQAHTLAGDEAVAPIVRLLEEIARGLSAASEGRGSADDLSLAFRDAEVDLQRLRDKLAEK